MVELSKWEETNKITYACRENSDSRVDEYNVGVSSLGKRRSCIPFYAMVLIIW